MIPQTEQSARQAGRLKRQKTSLRVGDLASVGVAPRVKCGMRRFARWMLNALAVVSLLLCVATALLWAVSYRQFIDVGQISTFQDKTTFTQHLIRLGSNNGRFLFTRRDLMWPRPVIADNISDWEKQNGWYLTRKPPFDMYYVFARQPGDHSWHKYIAGVRFTRAIELGGNRSRSMIGFVLFVPHAYVCLALAILPAFRGRRVLRRWRANRRGLCQKCFYDLKGNVSGVCPECGTAVGQTSRSDPGRLAMPDSY